MRPVRRARTRLLCSLVVALLAGGGGAVVTVARAEKASKPATPLRVTVTTKSGPVTGRVISYDDQGFQLLVKEKDTRELAWSDLDAASLFRVRKPLAGRDAGKLIDLGRELLPLDGGKEWADKAFADALKVDPKRKDEVEKIKSAPPPAPAAEKGPGKGGAKGGAKDGGANAAGGEMAGGGGADDAERAGPKAVGGVQAQFWKELTPEQNAAAVASLKAFAEDTQRKLNKPLQLEETAYFLFYSDLKPEEAKKWAALLDRMQSMLATTFDVKPNIWRGKALVFVFRLPADYMRFQQVMHNTDGSGTRGMCHTYGDGMVHIAFFRQANELEFAHVLVHESSHGFLHRFMTPVNVPSWANEGLAEWIANTLVPREKRQKEQQSTARNQLKQHQGVGAMFEAEHIEGWQYPVAEMLTTFMIDRYKKRYVGFITGIKQGLDWEASLQKHLNMNRQQLLEEFGKGMGV
jgi:hypothetical protein